MTAVYSLADTDRVPFTLTGLDIKGAAVTLPAGYSAAWSLTDPSGSGATLTPSVPATSAVLSGGVPGTNLMVSAAVTTPTGRVLRGAEAVVVTATKTMTAGITAGVPAAEFRWMIQSAGVTALAAQPAVTPGGPTGAELAKAFFDRPSAMVVGTPVPGYAATQVTSWQSYAKASAAWTVTPPARGSWVMYDNEWEPAGGWPTPAVEQASPALYMGLFNELAHSLGLNVINVPAVDLMGDTAAVCYMGSSGIKGEKEWQAYLRCGIPGFAASADVLSIQSQSLQVDVATSGNADSFAAMLTGAIAQLPAGHLVYAGLTTERGDPVTSMIACWEAMPPGVAGCWLNGNANTGAVLAEFLTELTVMSFLPEGHAPNRDFPTSTCAWQCNKCHSPCWAGRNRYLCGCCRKRTDLPDSSPPAYATPRLAMEG